jgi:hypothetical protein
MVGTRTKLNRALAVVVPFHGQTANAFAAIAAYILVSHDIAIVVVQCVLPFSILLVAAMLYWIDPLP